MNKILMVLMFMLSGQTLASWTVVQYSKDPSYMAPDGMKVWNGPAIKGASHAVFELSPQAVTNATYHRTVDEIYYFISGEGEMWLKEPSGKEEIVKFKPGLAVTIPQGVSFQLRNTTDLPALISGITSPPWPGNDTEAVVVDGKWRPTLELGTGHS